MLLLLTLGLLLSLLSPGFATTWYVDNDNTRCPTCSDANNCTVGGAQTITTAKDTIAAGLACMAAAGGVNHRVEVRGSTTQSIPQVYAETLRTLDLATRWLSGAAGTPNTLASYTGEYVALRPPSGSTNVLQFGSGSVNTQYVVIDGTAGHTARQYGLVLDGADTTTHGIYLTRSANLTFRGVEISHMANVGVDLSNTSGFVSAVTWEDCAVHHSGTASIHHGLRLRGPTHRLSRCEIYSNAGYGVQVVLSGAAATYNNGTILDRNDVHDNATGGASTGQIAVDNCSTCQVRNNLIRNSPAGTHGLAIAATTNGVQVANNTFYNAQTTGISITAGAVGTALTNNIVVGATTPVSNAGIGTVETTNLLSSSLSAVTFVNASGSPPNMTPTSTNVDDDGTSLAGTFTDDYAGGARSVPWSIGAVETDATSPVALAFAPPPGNTVAGEIMTPAVVVCAQVSGITQTTFAASMALTLTSGTGTLTGGAGGAPTSGCRSFPALVLSTAGAKTLTATASGATSATANVTITPAPTPSISSFQLGAVGLHRLP